MALTATLRIDNHSYYVMECDYEFSQEVDFTGRPSDRPRGGLINLVISAPDDNDLGFHEWMFDKNLTKDGEIELVINKDSIDKHRIISFKDAYCVRLYEYFNNNNPLQMYMKIGIMAGSIIFGQDCEFNMID